jgi:shikimate dehydrogenase
MHFVGLNLTVPHKLMALGMMEELDESARHWGAVNTVSFEGQTPDGSWRPLRDFPDAVPGHLRAKGYNTDAYGLTASLREDLGIGIERARVLLLGAGGAGRTAALQLAESGVAALFLVNRTQDKADALASEIRARFPAVEVCPGYPGRDVDLVINATSLGLKPEDPLPLNLDRFPLKAAGALYDMVYRPIETRLLADARAAGVRAVNGLGMLLHQGVRAFEIWTGQAAPTSVMKAALQEELYGH